MGPVEFVQPTVGVLSILVMLAFMALPIAVLTYTLWLLTRLTRAVERIEVHLSGDLPPRSRPNEDR